MPTLSEDRVDSRHPDYDRMLPEWKRARDFAAGDAAVKREGELYLPRPPEMDPGRAYEMYLGSAPFMSAVGRTLDALTGAAEREEPRIEAGGIPAEELEDVTRGGLGVLPFSYELLRERLLTARGVVEVLPAEDGRASWRLRKAEDLISWRVRNIAGRQVADRVVFALRRVESDGEWRETATDEVRVLSLEGLPDAPALLVRHFRRQGDKGEWQEVSREVPLVRGDPMDFIPVAVCGGSAFRVIDLPLGPIAALNASHYRTSALLAFGASKTALPTPVLKLKMGGGAKTQPEPPGGIGPRVGSARAGGKRPKYRFGFAPILLQPDEDVEILEFQGRGLSELSAVVERYERQMVSMGARLTFGEPSESETATAAAIKSAADASVLVAAARDWDFAMTQALRWHAFIRGSSGQPGFESSKDFLAPVAEEAERVRDQVEQTEEEA